MALLIDIEGIDGSGKGTQARRLVDRFVQSGVAASLISFPRYGKTLFGRAVGEFLNGEYGALDAVHPFLVSLLFAGDRFESKGHLLEVIGAHQVVVFDRYVPSNVAHQASKLDGDARTELARRIEEIEYGLFGLPRPDRVLLLDLPVAAAQELVARKLRDYTTRAADLQEADARYLQRVRESYLEMAGRDASWSLISCVAGSVVRTIDAIADEIWEQVRVR